MAIAFPCFTRDADVAGPRVTMRERVTRVERLPSIDYFVLRTKAQTGVEKARGLEAVSRGSRIVPSLGFEGARHSLLPGPWRPDRKRPAALPRTAVSAF